MSKEFGICRCTTKYFKTLLTQEYFRPSSTLQSDPILRAEALTA